MEKVSLPIKTKIAALWMMIMGGIPGCFSLVIIFQGPFQHMRHELGATLFFMGGLAIFFGGLVSFLWGIFLLQRKKWAWLSSIEILLTVGFILAFVWFFILLGILPEQVSKSYKPILLSPLLLPLVPFILLLLDRKNFFKIAS